MPASLAGSFIILVVFRSRCVFPLLMVVGGSSVSPLSLSKCSSVLSFGFMLRALVVLILISINRFSPLLYVLRIVFYLGFASPSVCSFLS